MRLTTELIQAAPTYLNPLKERELDLRGHKIPAIENLGVARDQDSIDFTDNDISVLSNFPLSPRLRTLLLARNRVATIQQALPRSIPRLTTLVLAGNAVAELADLDPLSGFGYLTHLVLLDNPVTRRENYRYYVLWRCKSVRFLDYTKVKQAEREHADELFGTLDEPTALAAKIMGIKSRTFDVPATSADPQLNGRSRAKRVKLNARERARVEEMIRKAGSLEDVARLEKELNEGRIPGGAIADDMEE